jgi:Flp pilus assembly protein TadD
MKKAALALCLVAACAHRQATQAVPEARPVPDADAIAEATRDSYEPRPYVSARAYSHYLQALLARDDDNFEAATAELREALLYDPESPHLHSVLAEVLLRQGRAAEAEEHLHAALAAEPGHAPALLLLARIAEARERPDQARGLLRSAIAAQPEDPDAARELVRLEIAQGDLSAARTAALALSGVLHAAQQAAARDKSEDDGETTWTAEKLGEQTAGAWVDVARAFAAQHEDPADAFARAREAQPSDPEALAAEAGWLESRRRYEEARVLQLRLLAQRPEGAEVIAALARLSLEEGDAESASAHAKKLLALAADLEPFDATLNAREDERREVAGALLRVAVPLLGARRSGEAQAALEGALRLYPDHPELAFYRGLALGQRGRPREGAQALDRVERTLRKGGAVGPAFLGIEPATLLLDTRVQAALLRGKSGEKAEACRELKALFAEQPLDEGVDEGLLEAFDRAGRGAEAAQLLAAASRAHPESEGLLFGLANALDREGRKPDALAAMRKLLLLAPQNVGALNYVGYSLAEQNASPASLREAELLLSRAVDLRPDDGAVADSYGYCLLRRGDAGHALEEIARADHLSPGDPVILSHLGDALLANGRRAEALRAFRGALERLAPAGVRKRRASPAQASAVDPPDRVPDPDDARVRDEIEAKLRSLTVR